MHSHTSIDIKQLRAFILVAETGNISKAAQQLNLTQSAVSQLVAQLEATVKAKLFDRSKRPLNLTSAGVTVSRRAKSVLFEMDKLLAEISQANQLHRAEVRLGMIDSFSATVGPHIIHDALKSSSRVLAWSGLAHAQSQGLIKRQLDLIISSDPCHDTQGLTRTPLLQEPFLIAVPMALRKQFEETNDLNCYAQLAPFIRFSARSHYGSMIERHLRRENITIPHFLEIDSADVVMAMVAAGLGWALISPLCILQGVGYIDNIYISDLPNKNLTRTVYLISRTGEHEEVVKDIVISNKNAIEKNILPKLEKKLPWLGSKITAF